MFKFRTMKIGRMPTLLEVTAHAILGHCYEHSRDVRLSYLPQKVGDRFSHSVIRKGSRLHDVLLMSCHFSSNPISCRLCTLAFTNHSTFNLTHSHPA